MGASASVAFSYSSELSAYNFRDQIERQKKISGDRINIMRPDEWISGLWSVSHLKLLDNVICDTVRLKFRVQRSSEEAIWSRLTSHEKSFFDEASFLFDKFQMYHRSPSDGYFAIKSRSGFYITSTKTKKDVSFDRLRIAEVLDYNLEQNLVTFSAPYLPSSDRLSTNSKFQPVKVIETELAL